jgi:hypothetical protein
VPLRKVKVWLDNRDIDTVGGEIKNFPFAAMLWQAPTLRADDKPAISLDSGFYAPAFIEKANVSVRVEYQAWFIPWTRTKTFSFKVFRQTDGEPDWWLFLSTGRNPSPYRNIRSRFGHRQSRSQLKQRNRVNQSGTVCINDLLRNRRKPAWLEFLPRKRSGFL